MYPVNSQFHELATSGSPTTRCRIYFIDDSVDCTDDNDVQTNGTLLVRDPGDTDSNRRISGDNGVVFSDLFNSEKNIVIGATVSKPIQIALLNLDGGLNSFDFGRCKIYIDVYDTDNAAWLPCPMGVYIIDTPTKLNTKIVNASGYDQMQKLDKTADAWWNNIDWTNGVTVSELISQIATECGVSVSANLSTNILNGSNSYTEAPLTANKTTYRDILGKLAGITGTIAYFDRDGALDMRWFEYAELSSTTETLTGDPVSFVNGGDSTITSLSIPFSPIQSGSGTPSPDNVRPISGRTGLNVWRTGKNLLNPDSTAWSNRGTTYSYINNVVPDGQTARFTLEDNDTTVDISGISMGFVFDDLGDSRPSEYCWYIQNGNVANTNRTNKAINGEHRLCRNVMVYPQASLSTLLQRFNIMVELGSTATDYKPYDGSTYISDWTSEAGTVYGGTLDVVTGVLTVTHSCYTITGSEAWNTNSANRNRYYSVAYLLRGIAKLPTNNNLSVPIQTSIGNFDDSYNSMLNKDGKMCIAADGRIGINADLYDLYGGTEVLKDVQICYELATPITYNLTAQEVELLVGQNYVWADTGEDVTATITTRNIVTVDADALGSGVMSLDVAEYAVTAIDMLEVLPLDPDLDVSIGTGDNIYQLAGNPFIVGADADAVETLATPIYDRLKTVVPYKPLDMRLISDWSIESGDVIRAIIDGNTVVLPIMQQTMTWRGGYVLSDMQSSGDAERPGMDWQERTTYQNDVQMHEFANTVNELLSRIQDMTGNYSLIQQTVSAIEQTVSAQGTTIQSILDPTGQIWTAIKTNSADLSDLEDAVNGEISERKSYIRFLPAEPAIVLGVDTGNEIKLKLVNNIIYFFNGSDDSTDLSLAYAYFNNEEAGADRFVATQSVQIGNADSASRWLFKTLLNGDLILDMV